MTQDAQLACFQCVSKALKAGGYFVIEAVVPDLGRFDQGQCTRTSNVSSDYVVIEGSQHDLSTQTVTSLTPHISTKGTRLYPAKLRYAWPSEIDLMARICGMKLESRWRDWNRSEFSSDSRIHILVFKKINATRQFSNFHPQRSCRSFTLV